ncbi:MAG: spherulation-specific family 4 protein [Dermatophilaceae bacterium]
MTTHWGVPLYLHPAVDPATWEWVGRTLRAPDFVVVNVSNGPGRPNDPYYLDAIETVRGCELVGYVDVAYGRRPARAVRDDAAAWRDHYGVRSVMLDQVPSAAVWHRTMATLVAGLRADGATQLVANPGSAVAPELAGLFDISAVFEGSWADYVTTPPRATAGPGSRPTWHLVHSCPSADQDRALELARDSGAAYVFVTERALPNPYDTIPHALRSARGTPR